MTWEVTHSADGIVTYTGTVTLFPSGDGVAPLLVPIDDAGLAAAGFEPIGYFSEMPAVSTPHNFLAPVDGDGIDAMVNQSLAAGPVDDYSINRYDKCWRCQRDWHGLAITQAMEEMRLRGAYDEDYRWSEDHSKVLCPGSDSDFIGPVLPVFGLPVTGLPPSLFGWITDLADLAITCNTWLSGDSYTLQDLEQMRQLDWRDRRRWWRTTLPCDARITEDTESFQFTIATPNGYRVFDGESFALDGENVYVLQDSAPVILGTWEPTTAPGVTSCPVVQQYSRGL